MSKKIGVLFCSAGRRVGLMNAFRQSAEQLGLEAHIVACDLVPNESAACYLADQAYGVPRATNPDYAAAVHEIAKKEDVRLVVPTIDTELLALARARAVFDREDICLHVSSEETINIARDKARTAQTFAKFGVSVPTTYREEDVRDGLPFVKWPIFAKPAAGSASRGLMIIDSHSNLPTKFDEKMIFQQMLNGDEYTVNMFVDIDGQLRTVVTHKRTTVRAGEVERGETVRHPAARSFAEKIVRAMPGLRGVACFQFIDDPVHGPCVFEINVRFGGGYPLAHHAGAEFAKWLLEEIQGLPVSAHDSWREGVSMCRYDEAIFSG